MILLQNQSIEISDPQFMLLYIPVLVWTVLLVILFIYLLRRFTFGKWTNRPNPYHSETLGMPRGVIRAVLSVSLLFFVLLFESFALIFDFLESRTEQLFTAFQLMMAFYFGGKVMHHLSSTDKKKNRDVADAVKQGQAKNKPQSFDDNDSVG